MNANQTASSNALTPPGWHHPSDHPVLIIRDQTESSSDHRCTACLVIVPVCLLLFGGLLLAIVNRQHEQIGNILARYFHNCENSNRIEFTRTRSTRDRSVGCDRQASDLQTGSDRTYIKDDTSDHYWEVRNSSDGGDEMIPLRALEQSGESITSIGSFDRINCQCDVENDVRSSSVGVISCELRSNCSFCRGAPLTMGQCPGCGHGPRFNTPVTSPWSSNAESMGFQELALHSSGVSSDQPLAQPLPQSSSNSGPDQNPMADQSLEWDDFQPDFRWQIMLKDVEYWV